MLDPDKLIREGIETGNSQKIALGKKLKAKKLKTEERSLEPYPANESSIILTEEGEYKHLHAKGNGPVRGGKNTWTDDLSESRDVLQDAIKERNDGKTIYNKLVRRDRQAPKRADYPCRICSKIQKGLLITELKKDSEDQSLYYECDKCIMGKRSET